ncbi:MAG: hypothetical protein QHH06_09890 [Clostridiales bacterium]|nr:hypothetical protein [Eubacteriales bacterium]MDH7566775.1 hypothetical protein [Clostridiales bacterium]
MEKKEYCYNCDEDTEYIIEKEIINLELEGVKFSYEALVPYCVKCKKEVSIPEINDLNIIRAYKAHKEALDKS